MRALVWAKVLGSDPSAGVRPPAESEAAHTRKSALSAATFKTLLALPAAQHPRDPLRAARDYVLLLGGQLCGGARQGQENPAGAFDGAGHRSY